MATIRQTEANRRNSLFSTGARTLAGSLASSQNARTHGMAAEAGTNPGEKILIEDTRQEWIDELKPVGARQWAAAERWMAAEARLEWCRMVEDAWRYRQARRAELNWDEDCRFEALKLAAKLAKDPVLTVAKLRQTLHGCVWLEQQLRLLAGVLARQAGAEPGGEPATALPGLDGADRSRALDLMGLSAEERLGPTRLDPPAGSLLSPGAHQAALLAEEIASLVTRQADVVSDLNELDRVAAKLELGPGVDSTLRLIRRYETAADRRRIEATAEMKQLKAEAETAEMERRQANRREPVRRRSEPAEVPPTPRRAAEEPRAAEAEVEVEVKTEASAVVPASPEPAPAEFRFEVERPEPSIGETWRQDLGTRFASPTLNRRERKAQARMAKAAHRSCEKK